MTKSPVSKQEGYAVNEDTVVSFRQPGSFSADPLTDVLRSGVRRFLAQEVEAEVEAHIAAHSGLTAGQGRRRIVRHGYLPEREIQTGIGAARVQAPRVRDRSGGIRYQGPGPVARLLQLPGRTLEAHPHHQPDRKHLRRRPSQDSENKRLPQPQDRPRHDLQTDLERKAEMAEAERVRPTGRHHRRSAVQGRDHANRARRLIKPSPTVGHSLFFMRTSHLSCLGQKHFPSRTENASVPGNLGAMYA